MHHSARSVLSLLCVMLVSFALVGCSRNIEVSRQYCPTEGVLADTERLLGGEPGRSWQGQITGTVLDCSWNPEERKRVTALTVRGSVIAGNDAGVPSKLNLPAFVVILNPEDKQLFRKDFDVNISADSGLKSVGFSKEVGDLTLNLASGDSIKGYAILVGFRLTPDQLRANRTYREQKLGL